MKKELEQLMSEMRSEARAHNKFLTDEYLLPLEPRMLSALTQPSSRPEYLERLRQIEQAEALEMKEKSLKTQKWFNERLPVRPSARRNVNGMVNREVNSTVDVNSDMDDMS
jgi:hypothetical protein